MCIYMQTLELALIFICSVLLIIISCLIRSHREYKSRETNRSVLREAKSKAKR